MSETRTILHVDMDAFFAAVEQHDNPALKGKPVIVGGLGNRGVVSTASYEARPSGVHSALPMARARRLCPHGVFLPVRMARYRAVSARVFECFRAITPKVEGLSLDEAFLDVTDCRSLFGGGKAIAQRLKQAIFEHTGLTASVGVAPNKFLAKLASDLEKPDALVVITDETRQGVLDPLPVTRLWGIGTRAAEKLNRAGIRTIGDLRLAGEVGLAPLLGNQAGHFARLARGIDARAVEPEREDKSVSSEETFETDLREEAVLAKALLHHAEIVGARLRAKGLKARTVTLKLRRADFACLSRRHSFEPATDSTDDLYREARSLLRQWLAENPAARLRLIGLGTAGFENDAQFELFAEDNQRGRRLDRVVDQIRHQFGDGAVKRGKLI
jgi:DNA polymerase-4